MIRPHREYCNIIAGVFLATLMMATGKELLNYVFEKVIAVPETEQTPPEEDQPSMKDQVRDFMGKIYRPSQREGQNK